MNGRVFDGGVWNKCAFLEAFEENKLSIPPAKPLPYDIELFPHVFVGDLLIYLSAFQQFESGQAFLYIIQLKFL